MKRSSTVTCDRERKWISLALDGELSELEQVVMAAHLERCADCRAYAAEVRAVTTALRVAPLDPVPNPIWVGAPARGLRAARMRLRVAPVASAAAAVAAAFIAVTNVPDRGSVGAGNERAAVATRSSDGSLVNELVLAVRRPRLAEGTQAVLPAVPGTTRALKPPLGPVPGV